MTHELWRSKDGGLSFFPSSNTSAKELLNIDAELIWTVEASNFFAAMTAYHEFMGWGVYRSEWEELDSEPYEIQDWDLILFDDGLSDDLTEQQADDLALEAQRVIRAKRQ